MIKAVINGCNGKMGKVLSSQIAEYDNIEVVAGIDRNPDDGEQQFPVYKSFIDIKEDVGVIIDFSHPNWLSELLEYAISKKIPLVIATTGFSVEEVEAIAKASKTIPILYSSNMSLGVNILTNLVKSAAIALSENFDIEIIEKHHNKKVDAPSGTALMIADAINDSLKNTKTFIYGREGKKEPRKKEEIGIHAMRGGTIAGEHTVLFAGADEIIEIKHTALSKNIFALGAIRGAAFITTKNNGLYTMDDIFSWLTTKQ